MDQIISSPLPALVPSIGTRSRVGHSSVFFTDLIICLAIVGDFAALLGASALGLFNRAYLHFGFEIKPFRPFDYLHGVMLGGVILLFILQFNGAYRKHGFLQRFSMVNIAFKSLAIWCVAFVAITFVFGMQSTVSRLFVFWAVVNSWILLVAWRVLLRRLLLSSAALLRDRVLVVGWSKESDALAKAISADPGHPYEVIGCTPSAHGKFWVRPPADIPNLGDYNALQELLPDYQPDILILADLDPSMGELVALAQLCVKENVQFKVIPSFFQIFASGLSLETISNVPVIGVSKLPLAHTHNRLLKRIVDIIGGTVGLILSAPLIAFFGMLIYRESPGPIFYSQNRMGQGGRIFKIYKLRSMKLNADAKGDQWAKENDPRRLKIGAFLRKMNIDETPQFWNVLKGDMSLVGPRPEMAGLITNFKEEIAYYNARHFAKPGITGYAQVNGLRGNTDLRERVRYDLYYLENWSLWFDFRLLLRTFFAHANAY